MGTTGTVVAAISACAAVFALGLGFLAIRTVRARSDRRFETVLERLDVHLGAIAATLERVVARAESLRARGIDDHELTIDFDELLRLLVAEAAARTGAEGAAIRVRGPGGEARSAEFGEVSSVQPLEAPPARPSGPFRAVTINWSYRPALETAVQDSAQLVTSALVVPIVEGGRETGALAAYAPETWSFGPEHVQALELLAEDAATSLAAARSFAEAERELTDTLTGVRNRTGYDVALERAVARARETGRPLSLLILTRDTSADSSDVPQNACESARDPVARELASLLARTTRATDVVCRRRDEQFGIVLQDTAGERARRLYGRLREAASQTSFGTARPQTFSSGLVEWRRDESSEALDARALAAVGKTKTEPLELVPSSDAPESLRRTLLGRLEQEISRARRHGQPLALLVARVEGLEQIGAEYGATAAERVLEEVESRLAGVIEPDDATARLADHTLVLVAAGKSARAELSFAALRGSLEEDPATHLHQLAISAGITELADHDEAHTVLDRAEQALDQAARTGTGTLVVALAVDEGER